MHKCIDQQLAWINCSSFPNNAHSTAKLQLLYALSGETSTTADLLLHKGELYHNFTYIKSQVDMTSVSHIPTNHAD